MSNNKTRPDDFAFACVDGNSHLQEGLTKREYFAAMAMQGFCANTNYRWHSREVSEMSVQVADELIKVLNNEQQ